MNLFNNINPQLLSHKAEATPMESTVDIPTALGKILNNTTDTSSMVPPIRNKPNSVSSSIPLHNSYLPFVPSIQSSHVTTPSNPGYAGNVVQNADTISQLLGNYAQGVASPQDINNLRSQAQQALTAGAMNLSTPGTAGGLNAGQWQGLANLSPQMGGGLFLQNANPMGQIMQGEAANANYQNEMQKQKAQAMLQFMAPQSMEQVQQNQSAYGNPVVLGAEATPYGAALLGNQGQTNPNPHINSGYLSQQQKDANTQAVQQELSNKQSYDTIWSPALVNNRINNIVNGINNLPAQYKVNPKDPNSELTSINPADVNAGSKVLSNLSDGQITTDRINQAIMQLPINSTLRSGLGYINQLATLPGGQAKAQEYISQLQNGGGVNMTNIAADANQLGKQINQDRYANAQTVNEINNTPQSEQNMLNIPQAKQEHSQQYQTNQRWQSFVDYANKNGYKLSPQEMQAEFKKANDRLSGGQ